NLLEMAQRWGSLRLEKDIFWERIKQVGGVVALLVGSFLCVILIANHRHARESQATQIALSTLRQRERQLKTVMDNQPSMVMLIDTAGRYILVNRQFERFIGRPAED
ncbi:PAS domain S-box protein, partial [Desulfovibrio desulfuricans]|uniref:PAS domain-containing protein n=1 Tax=Desulfovibrio desulfuricans TaxID=876 RepID=UPI0023B19241